MNRRARILLTIVVVALGMGCALWCRIGCAVERQESIVQGPIDSSVPTRALADRQGVSARTSAIVPRNLGGQEASLHILVVDDAGLRVPGARVECLRSPALSLGMTDPSGVLEYRYGEISLARDCLVASKEGFATGERYVSDPPEDEIVIHLRRGGTLQGQVSALGGMMDDWEGIRVVAAPSELLLALSDRDVAVVLSDPRTLCGSCSIDGTFRLAGASPRRAYSIVAGGNGWIQDASPKPVRVDQAPVQLQVAPLYGTRIRYTVGGERRAAFVRTGGAAWGVSANVDTRVSHFCVAGPLATSLAGAPADWSRDSRDERIILVTSQSGIVDAVPVDIRANLLGYTSFEATLRLARVTEGQDQDLALIPIAAGWSWVELAFTELARESLSEGGPGSLLLEDHFGTSVRLPVQSSELAGERATIRLGPIPAGAYAWTFRWWPEVSKLDSDPSGRFDAAPGAVVGLSIPSRNRGGLLVRLADAEQESYSGPARFFLSWGRTRDAAPGPVKGEFVTFARGPYLIQSLPPGAFDVRVAAPGRHSGPVAQVTIEPGVRQELALTFDRSPTTSSGPR